MPYAIHEIELTKPLPTLVVPEGHGGMALIVRRKDRPLGFVMQALPEKSVLAPDALAGWISRELAPGLLRESLLEELAPRAPGSPLPSLTVAICTRDRAERLARCLAALLDLRRPEEGDAPFEVLVVDNAPSDERTREVVTSQPRVRYVREARPGLNFARNRALREAGGELLAYLDDDVVVDRGWLDGLREAVAAHPDAAAFTGQVLPYALATEAQIVHERRGGFRRGFETIRYGSSAPDASKLYPCVTGIFGVGCNMAFRRDRLRELGGFDEALDVGRLPGGGDHDILYRVIRAGWPLVYEPRCLVFHEHRATRAELRHQYWTWGLSLMAFVFKAYRSDPPERARWRLLVLSWFAHQLRQCAKALRGRHALPAGLLATELWGGVVGLLGEYPRSQRRSARIRREHP